MSPAPAPRVLLIGLPRHLAVRTLDELLRQWPAAQVDALVAPGGAEPAARLVRQRYAAREARRVRFYEGRVHALDLGLSGEEYLELTARATHILNLAAIAHTGPRRQECHDLSFLGASRVVAFARDCPRLRRLAHFTTIHVSGTRPGVMMENELDAGQRFRNAMEEMAFRGERVVRAAMSALPITVFRPGPLLGDSQTGEVMAFEGPLKLMLKVMLAPRDKPIYLPGPCQAISNFTPADYVARAALRLLDLETTVSCTHHLCSPYPVSFRAFFEVLCAYLGRSMPTFGVPVAVYRGLLRIPGIENVLTFPKVVYDYFNAGAVHNCAQTLEALKGSGIVCPPFESYFPLGVEFARKLLQTSIEAREEAEALDPLDGA